MDDPLSDACRAHEERAVQLRVAVQLNVPLPPEGAPEFVRALRERRELPPRVCFFEKADGLAAETPPPRSLSPANRIRSHRIEDRHYGCQHVPACRAENLAS